MEKGKHPRRSIKGYVRAVLICLFIVFGVPVVCAGYLIMREYTTQYFSESQAAEICEGLKLPPEVKFCVRPEWYNAAGLREALEEVYAPESTSLNHVKSLFTLELTRSDERHLSYALPGDRYLTIFYQNDRVTRYRIENHEGDDLSRI
jgi:hypothetical protein